MQGEKFETLVGEQMMYLQLSGATVPVITPDVDHDRIRLKVVRGYDPSDGRYHFIAVAADTNPDSNDFAISKTSADAPLSPNTKIDTPELTAINDALGQLTVGHPVPVYMS